MNQTQRDKCEKIFKHYGEKAQLVQLQEELGELQSAISRYLNGKNNNMYEEMADVLIMINQFKTSENIVDKIIEDFINEKLNRQLSRIFGDSYSQDKKEAKESGWVEFDINENGTFSISPEHHNFKWYCWQAVLTVCKDLTAFGGWMYKDNGAWITTPMFQTRDDCDVPHYVNSFYTDAAGPAIPVKIRFWRERANK